MDALGVYDSWYAVNSDPAARPKEDYPMLIYYLGYEVMKYLEDHDGWQTLLPKGAPKKMRAIGEISVEELRPYIKEALEYMAGFIKKFR